MASDSVIFQEAAKLVRQGVKPEDVGDMPYIGLEHIEEGTLRLIGIGNAKDVTSTKFRFSKGDILFGKLRPYFRKVIRVNFDGVCSTDIWVVRSKQDTDQGYLYYWMASKDFVSFATQGSEGTKMPRAKWEHVGRFQRRRLQETEQRAIAHILGSLDDKIELNHRMNQTLEAMARAIFKSWFVDFDPVRAKAEGRDTGQPDEIAALFPDSLEDSELGEIPTGWEAVELGNLSHILNGFAFKSKDYCGSEGIRVLRTKNFTESGYATKRTDDVFLPNSFLGSHKQYICEPFDYHLVMVGASVGKTSLLLPNMLPALRNQNMWCFRPKGKMLSKFYLSYSVRRKVEGVLSWADGSARSFFRKSDFRKHKIILPSEDLLKLFEDKTKSYFGLIASNTAENETLATLRDTLLSKLISGELHVPDAEKFVEEALV